MRILKVRHVDGLAQSKRSDGEGVLQYVILSTGVDDDTHVLRAV